MISRREWVTRTLCDDAGQSACFSFFSFFLLLYSLPYSHFVQKKFRNRNSTKWAIKPHSSSTYFFPELFFRHVWPIILCQAWWNALSSFIDHLGIIVLEWVESLSDLDIYVKVPVADSIKFQCLTNKDVTYPPKDLDLLSAEMKLNCSFVHYGLPMKA